MSAQTIARIAAIAVSAALLVTTFIATATAETAGTAQEAQPTCKGRVATIVGTANGETIVGTDGRDVIAALGGDDRVLGGGGNDLICGGAGDDVLVGHLGRDGIYGGPGNDRLFGGQQRDRLRGGQGDDTITGHQGGDLLRGGSGNDRLSGGGGDDVLGGGPGDDTIMGGLGDDTVKGERERDRLFGGPGYDRLLGGPGYDRLDGGAQWDRCHHSPYWARSYRGWRYRGQRARCEWPLVRRPGTTFVVAFVDLDGDHRFGPDDVLISRLVDTDRDGLPSRGDTIEMGRYPIKLDPKSIGDTRPWGVSRHLVARVQYGQSSLYATTTTGGTHTWWFSAPWRRAESAYYFEYNDFAESAVWDGPETVSIQLVRRSPSRPSIKLKLRMDGGEGRLIDILAYQQGP